jgi:hypothetical protein
MISNSLKKPRRLPEPGSILAIQIKPAALVTASKWIVINGAVLTGRLGHSSLHCLFLGINFKAELTG